MMIETLFNTVDVLSFYTGVILGAGIVIALQQIAGFIVRHWKVLVILSAVVSAVALVGIAL
jgi:hypothetical protein